MRSALRSLLHLALGSVLLLACAERDPGRPDVGDIDAPSPPDAGAADTGSPSDAPGFDVGSIDGGPPIDGGETDGGLVSMPCMATGTCDPFDVASCPMGQSCRLGAMGTECLPLFTTVARVGEACTRTDGCEPGSLCLDFGSGFLCQPMCPAGSIGDCAAGFACTGRTADDCVRVCRPLPARCDIYLQDCADPLLACTLVTNGETGERFTGCRPPGTVALGEMCGGMLGTCRQGLICVSQAGVSLCRGVCNPEAGGPGCMLPETCNGTTTGWGVRYCRDPG